MIIRSPVLQWKKMMCSSGSFLSRIAIVSKKRMELGLCVSNPIYGIAPLRIAKSLEIAKLLIEKGSVSIEDSRE